ncbi:hypothetical protein DFQ28_010518 [Apophysomyces sp. BC1034]|nr:hypothetical protein DFQ28_010518 [Apophysomyces sp. BC1034]
MSNSAIIAAKKRIETSLRNFQLKTDSQEPDPGDVPNTTKLNWTNSIFIKYRHDAIYQPKRTSNTRKKWPHMKYLGTCTLELGPHVFPETTFYEAIRVESWAVIAANATVCPKPTNTKDNEAASATTKQSSSPASVQPSGSILVEKAQQEAAVGSTITSSEEKVVENTEQNAVPPASADASNDLIFTDVVMEFKEVPNERFLFPKDVILELVSMQAPFELYASFLLPLDPASADDFFKDPKTKMEKWGGKSSLGLARKFAADAESKKSDELLPKTTEKERSTCLPANMRMIDVDGDILKSLVAIITKPEIVREKMMKKMEVQPTKSILRLHSRPDSNDRAVEDMLQRLYSIPEIITGPVLAEKKRNEMINAVKLGKRPRNEQETEGEMCSMDEVFDTGIAPKSKHAHVKDDGLRRCHYCSTKHTAMWRAGPAGSGTLCNGCGLLWKQGKILKGAPVISQEEEKKLRKEQREKERLLFEEQERERQRQEQEKQRAAEKARLSGVRQSQPSNAVANLDPSRKDAGKNANASRANIGYFAAQFLQQQHQQQTSSTQKPRSGASGSPSAPVPMPATFVNVQTPIQSNGATPKPSPTPVPVQAQPPPAAPAVAPAPALSLYNSAGIPLPTLSIDFGQLAFTHPNCGVTLVEGSFSIRLCKDGFGPSTVDIDKSHLQNAQFEIITEGHLGREVLIMTCFPSGGRVEDRFNTTLIKPNDYRMKIQFLEKLDPSGGAVVKRILQRWLSTAPAALSS